jgi:hypothetical protein
MPIADSTCEIGDRTHRRPKPLREQHVDLYANWIIQSKMPGTTELSQTQNGVRARSCHPPIRLVVNRSTLMNNMKHSKRPIIVCVIVFITAAVSAAGSNDPWVTLACGFGLALMIGFLWRLDEPPILLLPAGMQFVQVVTPLFYANLLGVSIQDVSLHIGDVTKATWLGLAAVMSLVVGLWCGQLRARESAASTMAWPPRTAFIFCLATMALALTFEMGSAVSEGLKQPLLAAGGIQWVGVFVLTGICVSQRRGYSYLLIVICLEVIKGFTGFFADFKSVFLVVVVATFAEGAKLGKERIFAAGAAAAVLLVLSVWWSAIKTEYRNYISQGSIQQVVVVPFADRIWFLLERLSQADGQTMSSGFDRAVKRIGYVDFLAATMRYVPSHMPFQDGTQIGATIMHILQPRLLFPDKPPLRSDTEILQKYTGFRYGKSTSASTSVSMGYVAELYVDFGPLGAMVGTFIMGLLAGRAVRFVSLSPSLPTLINYGLTVMLAMTLASFEESLIKIVGSFITTLCVVLVLRRYLLPRLLALLGLLNHENALAEAV